MSNLHCDNNHHDREMADVPGMFLWGAIRAPIHDMIAIELNPGQAIPTCLQGYMTSIRGIG
jgi:hypothetical protein